MLIYSSLILLVLFFYPLVGKKYFIQNGLKIKKNNNIYIIVVSLVLVLVLGLRGLTVGIDTINYYNLFTYVKNMELNQLFVGISFEYGYRMLQYVIGLAFNEYQFLLICVASFYILVVSHHIYKYSKNPNLSYILFILYGFYTFAFSTTRQTIAIAFIMIAYEFIDKRQLLRFLSFVLIAASFHITALIFIPSYWITKFKFNKFTISLFAIITLLMLYFRPVIVLFLNSIARNEYTYIETGGNLLFLFMVISVFLGIVYQKKFLIEDNNNKLLFYMLCMSILIMPITKFHPAMMRLTYYYFIFMIIYIPNLVSVIKDPIIRIVGYTGYVFIGLFYFYTNVIPSARLGNYLFFWQ